VYPPMKMEWTCSETSAYKIQKPGNYPEESIQHSEYGESLKSRISKDLQHIFTNIRLRIDNLFLSEKRKDRQRHDKANILLSQLHCGRT
jgi:hypothetical protein